MARSPHLRLFAWYVPYRLNYSVDTVNGPLPSYPPVRSGGNGGHFCVSSQTRIRRRMFSSMLLMALPSRSDAVHIQPICFVPFLFLPFPSRTISQQGARQVTHIPHHVLLLTSSLFVFRVFVSSLPAPSSARGWGPCWPRFRVRPTQGPLAHQVYGVRVYFHQVPLMDESFHPSW